MSNGNQRGNKASESSDPIDRYVLEHSLRLTQEQNELIDYTNSLPGLYLSLAIVKYIKLFFLGRISGMLGSPDEAQLFQVLVKLMGSKRCSKISLRFYSIKT